MTCPYCGYLCRDTDTICPVCKSILPPSDFRKNVIVSEKKNDKPSEASTQDTGVMVKSSNHFKKLFEIDNNTASIKSPDISYDGDIADIFGRLKGFASSHGAVISDDDLRILLSSVSAGRLVYCRDSEECRKAIELISRFFGNPHMTVLNKENIVGGCNSILGDWRVDENGEKYYKDTEFLAGIYTASMSTVPYFIAAGGLSEPSKQQFSDFVRNYVRNPFSADVIKISNYQSISNKPKLFSYGQMIIPGNIFNVILIKSDEKLSDDAAFCYFPIIDVSAKLSGTHADDDGALNISTMLLAKICGNAGKDNYISESVWKKIDDIEKFINDNAGSFCFDNRLLRNTERFSSVFIATGGSEADAADCIFAFYILPALRRTRPDFDAWKEKFADILIQKFSGISTMERSKKFLKK